MRFVMYHIKVVPLQLMTFLVTKKNLNSQCFIFFIFCHFFVICPLNNSMWLCKLDTYHTLLFQALRSVCWVKIWVMLICIFIHSYLFMLNLNNTIHISAFIYRFYYFRTWSDTPNSNLFWFITQLNGVSLCKYMV